MSKKNKNTSGEESSSDRSGSKDPFELDLGLGKFNLGNILKGFGKFIDLAEKLEESGGELKREGEFKVKGAKDLKGIYGFSIRTGVARDGSPRPVIRPFGNIKKTPKGETVVEDAREPIVDVFEESNHIVVAAELPGVAEEEITYKLNGDVLILNTRGKNKYTKEILLPSPVVGGSVERNYKNGILELRFPKLATS